MDKQTSKELLLESEKDNTNDIIDSENTGIHEDNIKRGLQLRSFEIGLSATRFFLRRLLQLRLLQWVLSYLY